MVVHNRNTTTWVIPFQLKQLQKRRIWAQWLLQCKFKAMLRFQKRLMLRPKIGTFLWVITTLHHRISVFNNRTSTLQLQRLNGSLPPSVSHRATRWLYDRPSKFFNRPETLWWLPSRSIEELQQRANCRSRIIDLQSIRNSVFVPLLISAVLVTALVIMHFQLLCQPLLYTRWRPEHHDLACRRKIRSSTRANTSLETCIFGLIQIWIIKINVGQTQLQWALQCTRVRIN